MELYEKLTSPSGRVSYKPVSVPHAPPVRQPHSLTMTEGQIVSAVGGLAVMAIHGYQTMLPKHKLISRKVQAVNDSVLEMFRGTGQPIDEDMVDFISGVWNATMEQVCGDTA